jgi:hypothetical protein
VQRVAADKPDEADRMNDAVFDAAPIPSQRTAPPPFLPSYRFWSLTPLDYLLV